MMRRKRYTVAAALLLCAVKALCSDGVQNQTCVSSWKLECFQPADHLEATDPVILKLSDGKQLIISLEGLPNNTVCQWRSEKGQMIEINRRVSTVIPQLSMTDSGRYNLSCGSWNGTNVLKTVDLDVAGCPSKPQLSLDKMDDKHSSPYFKCISKGSPSPKIQFRPVMDDKQRDIEAPTEESSTISTTLYYISGVMCCATNNEGQECTQLHDFAFDTNSAQQHEVSSVTISPGDPLVLRCRNEDDSSISWEYDGKVLVNKANEICIREDRHYQSKMVYVFIKSVTFNHSGRYTCNKFKSVDVHVTAESFLSSQLPNQFVITQNNSCLEAGVSYHPMLQYCYWEAPDGSVTKCIMDLWVANNRTLKYCNSLQSGVYKLHLAAGGKTETKTTTVCVVDAQTQKFREENNHFVVETVSTLPANSTWMSSSSSNNSFDTDTVWEVIREVNHPVSGDFCNMKLYSSISQDLVTGEKLKFCLKNQVWLENPWCNVYYVYGNPKTQAFRADPPSDNSVLLLKIGTMALLLALALVSVLLLYYIKKKKPQYQPHLQMIQMVGPNDNDYIYINFKDFIYDQKWEFPRQNLKLGKELGSGAFGRVVQATAYGINQPGVSQQVAVKMLQEKHHSVEKEALMSELKMLTHIGQHDNIVNLLGACTETGPIYLIFQYCCYGDLLNYLKKSGDRYHKSVTDAFNRDRFSSLYHNLQPKKNSKELITTANNYVPMQDSTTRGQENVALITFSSNDMEDPEMYESEEDQTELQALTFDDLLSFAFQVAKGMEFLSSKNCIHRDLAARNVLITKGWQVKIGDFGLARDIENDSNYVVRGNVRLPVKWMAPESIFQGMYTMKSDVWAYGILLWEIFSLGVTPYPGIKVDHTFYTMIERGFKMECPYYASDSVYGIMCKCWALNSNSRPSFSKLVDFMSDLLLDREEKLYQNIFDQNSSDYQNTSTCVDVSALVKESGSKSAAANDYCKANVREENKAEAWKSEVVVEEEPLKLCDEE
ncbi:receptor-type tyrosine-protein kinase FLT3 [Girardinichthys multiradiatus]|uniref:receptor-type tyrosine-protein kinase FLT3 n=1 Tax=Girardinichthys multiradiatus TaxID=208333 RepID=UPI001FABE960|nr:receptor-type tyrosine-protein kinase FLT3 [Girardinichthys multiradiatus]